MSSLGDPLKNVQKRSGARSFLKAEKRSSIFSGIIGAIIHANRVLNLRSLFLSGKDQLYSSCPIVPSASKNSLFSIYVKIAY